MRKIWYGFTTGLGFWLSLGVLWIIGTVAKNLGALNLIGV